MTVEIELLILIVLVVVLASGAIEYLRQIRNAIQENYQASLARAMTQTDIVVKQEKEKIEKECTCGHPFASHCSGPSRALPGPCQAINCNCERFRPKRGPWPGELKV